MNISRDTRIDRRRRVLRDASLNELGQEVGDRGENRLRSSNRTSAEPSTFDPSTGKRSPGYSQDVRRACGTRLVQYIPVRLVSFSAVAGCSLTMAALLLTAHYLIYVNGYLPWYGHPLAVAFDATHPQSIAAWFGSHLWLLCLVSTILTFQLRKHKLDDYTGEYRLWFWLVLTCLIASIDSTTHLSELLGLALDRWSVLNMGWSGKALVQATMAVLIGVLGIRLCSELKSVPLSLVCWLTGLSLWAGGAALAEEKFRIDISLQMRYWLRAAFWLGGLTLIWIASLAYLRHVYIEAQRRFLLRNRLLARATRQPIAERLKKSMIFNPLKLLRRRAEESGEEPKPAPNRRRTRPTTESVTVAAAQANPVNPNSTVSTVPQAAEAATRSAATASSSANSLTKTTPTKVDTPETQSQSRAASNTDNKKRWSLKFWPFGSFDDEVAPEYQKVQRASPVSEPEAKNVPNRPTLKITPTEYPSKDDQSKLDRQAQLSEKQAAKAAAKEDKRVARESQLAERKAKREAARQAKLERKRNGQGWRWSRLIPLAALSAVISKIKLPSLSGFKLSPPESGDESVAKTSANTAQAGTGSASSQHPSASKPSSPQGLRPVGNDRPLPGTVKTNLSEDDDMLDDDRNLSKAERKRLRRQGRAA